MFNNKKSEYILIRRMISVILLVSFIITSSDTAFALAPSSKVLDESFKNEFALRFQDEIVHRTIGEALHLKMPVSGMHDMVDRCVSKSVPIIIDSIEDDAVFYGFRNYKGEMTSFGCFRSATEAPPTDAVWIKKIGDSVYWAQEIRPTERNPVEKIHSKSFGEIAEEKNKDGDVLKMGTQPSGASQGGAYPVFPVPGIPSFADFKKLAISPADAGNKNMLSPKEYFSQDFRRIAETGGADKRIIVVHADHFDIDALVSTLTMSYLLYMLMQRTGRTDVMIVPVIYGSASDVDPVAEFVINKVFKKDILRNMCFGKARDIFAQNNAAEYAQVDSAGTGNWLTIDHHPSGSVRFSDDGSRIERGPSAAFMIYEEYKAANLRVDVDIAWLTLYSIMADTLNFTENMVGHSNIYEQVCEVILPVIHLPKTEIGHIYRDYYDVAYDIRGVSPEDMLADTKSTYIKDVCVSQRFFSDSNEFFRKLPDIRQAMYTELNRGGKRAWIYIGTDVKTRRSYVFSVCAEGGLGHQRAVDAALSRGCVGKVVKDGIELLVRPEMLRKYLMEDTVDGLKDALNNGGVLKDMALPSEDDPWFETVYGIYSYAIDHAAELSWASVVYYQCRDVYLKELRRAMNILLSSDEKSIRGGAFWINSRPEFIGVTESSGMMRSNDGSIFGVLSDIALSDDEACGSVVNSYYRISSEDMVRRDLFFEEIVKIVLNDRPDGLSFKRACLVLDKLKGQDNTNDVALAKGADASSEKFLESKPVGPEPAAPDSRAPIDTVQPMPTDVILSIDVPKRAIPHILQAIKDGDVDGDIREAETIICPWDKNISMVKVKYFTSRGSLYYEFDGVFDFSRPAGKEFTHHKIFHLTRYNQGLVFDEINRRIVFHVEGPEGVSFDHPVTALSSIIGVASISLMATGALAALQEVLPEKQSIGNVDKFIGPHIIPVSICLGAGIIIAIILKIIFNKIRLKRIEWMLQEERFEQGRDYVTRVYYRMRSKYRAEEVKDTFSGRNIIELIKNSDHKKAVMGFNLLSHANQEFKGAIVSELKGHATELLCNNNFDGLMLFGEAGEELKNEILMALDESGIAFIVNAAKIELESYTKETEKRTMKNKTLSVLCDGSVRIGFGEALEKSPYEIEYSNIPKEEGEEKEGQLLVLDKQDPDNIRSVGRYRLPLGVTCIISGKGDEGWVDKDTYRIILDQSWFFDGINLSIKMSEDSGKYRAELTDLGSSLFLIRKKDGANWSASEILTGLNFTTNAYYYRLAKQKQVAKDVGKNGKPRVRVRIKAGKNVAGPKSATSVEAGPAVQDLSSEALPKVSKALEEAWAEFRSTNAVDLKALGKKYGLTDGELDHIAITVHPGQGAGSGESASGAAQDGSDGVFHKLPRVTRPAFVDLRSMPHDSRRDVWKTGLYDIGTLKKMMKAMFEAEKVTMDDWRYKVSLFALTDKEIDELIAYLRRLKVRKDNDAYYQLLDVRGDLAQYIARIRADGNVLIHLGAPVYQFCAELLPSIEELNRSIYNDGNPPQNHDYTFTALKGEYRSQLKEIRKYGGEIGLAVHGVRDWKWRDMIGQGRDRDIDIPDGKIRFLNVLLEGNIRSFKMPLMFSNLKMDVGYLDTKHDTSFSDNGDAGTYGPSFIILDRNWEYDAKGDISENHHKYYLVPNAKMKKFLINGVEKSVEAGLIDSVGADVRKDKIVTYGEYLDILSGKNVAPAALDNHFEPRDGGMDVPYEEKNIDVNLVHSTETVESFPAEFRSVDSAKFIGLYEKETGKKAAGEVLRFASILGRLNIASRQIYLTLTENGDRLYPSGCGPISSAVCQLLTDNGFEAFVRSNSGNDHFVATVRFVSEDKLYYFIIDYTADQFLKPLERKRTVISPVIIPFTGVSSIARPLRDFYESDEKNDYKPLVIDDVDDPAFVAYKILKQEFYSSGSGNSGAINSGAIPESATPANLEVVREDIFGPAKSSAPIAKAGGEAADGSDGVSLDRTSASLQDNAIAIREWMAFDSRRLSRFLCFSYGIVNGLLFEGARTVTNRDFKHCWAEIGGEQTGWLVDSSFDSASREIKSAVTSSEKYSSYLRDGVLVLPLKEGRQIYGPATELPLSHIKWKSMRKIVLGRVWIEDNESRVGADQGFDEQTRNTFREELLKNSVIPANVRNKIKIPDSDHLPAKPEVGGEASRVSPNRTSAVAAAAALAISEARAEFKATDGSVDMVALGKKEGKGDSRLLGQPYPSADLSAMAEPVFSPEKKRAIETQRKGLTKGFADEAKKLFDNSELLDKTFEVIVTLEGERIRVVNLGRPEVQALLKGVEIVKPDYTIPTRYTTGELLKQAKGYADSASGRHIIGVSENGLIYFGKQNYGDVDGLNTGSLFLIDYCRYSHLMVKLATHPDWHVKDNVPYLLPKIEASDAVQAMKRTQKSYRELDIPAEHFDTDDSNFMIRVTTNEETYFSGADIKYLDFEIPASKTANRTQAAPKAVNASGISGVMIDSAPIFKPGVANKGAILNERALEAREAMQAETLVNRIKILASEAKHEQAKEKVKVIIGIETAGWMPDEQKSDMQALTCKVKQLVNTLTRRGVLDNITVVLGNSETLLTNIANEKPNKFDKVVVLGSEKTLTGDSYKTLEAFKACIDIRQLGNLDYISLLEVLTVALSLGLGGDTQNASRLAHPGIGIETIGERIVRLIPSKKVDINEPSKIYGLQIKELAKQA